MVYNWDGKEAECYRLYVHERRSLQEVVDYWEEQGFTPSKRAFQTQFKRWGFPSKQNPAYKDHALTARVKELWEANTTQKDMLDTLQAEGFQISDRELMRVRTRFKWFLRESRSRNDDGETRPKSARPRKRGTASTGNDLIDQLAAAILQETGSSGDETEHEQSSPELPRPSPPASSLDPMEAHRRHLRQQQLLADSDSKWRARKRRRRTRTWAGLPADAPGEPPRFPSETTLDESKSYLDLDNSLYAHLRTTFHTLCAGQNVTKKTAAGPDSWASLLRALIRSSPHLTPIFTPYPDVFTTTDALWKPKNHKTLALDVICQDVTKRMRVAESRMSIPEAKRALGLNPSQARSVKNAFYEILVGDQFTDKITAGIAHWNELKGRWVEGEACLRAAVAPGDGSGGGEEQRAVRLRAIEVLARDVMKRFRAASTRAVATASSGTTDAVAGAVSVPYSKAQHRGPGPGPAPPSIFLAREARRGNTAVLAPGTTALRESTARGGRRSGDVVGVGGVVADAELQIDPSLLLAASDAAIFQAR